MIKEICPNCGGEIISITLACNPPIYEKRCNKCHSFWRRQDEVIEEIFDPKGWREQQC